MLFSEVKVSSRILSPAGRFPIREYEKPQDGFSKFIFCIQYKTPKPKEDAQADGCDYDYE